MTTIGIKELHIKGGGNVQYLWHVSGMPWAVCESDALRDLLDASTTARRAIFGLALDGSSAYIADTPARCPIFPTLQRPGKTSWTLNEIKGQLSGGSWSVKLLDIPLAHTWINFGSTGREGLPGVHHVAQPMVDSTAYYAELAADLEYNGASLVVDQIQGGTTWETAVESDVSASGYRLAWMGGECMVLDNSIASNTTATILSRGAFITRPQKHAVDPQGASPIVYDLPPSIAGQMCTLWACHMNDTGSVLLSTPVPIRTGRVSPDIKTDEGMTRIGINPILDNLNEEVTCDYGNEAHIMRYCFTRDDSGTDVSHVTSHFQHPHLIILERDITGADDGNYHCKSIWLCDQNSHVYFETLDDVLTALEDELAKCSSEAGGAANHTQVSGNGVGTNGYVELDYNYVMKDGYLYQTTGINSNASHGGTSDEGDSILANETSLLNGPLAWLFNLGGIYNNKDQALAELTYSPSPWFFYARTITGMEGDPPYTVGITYLAPPWPIVGDKPWMVCAGGSNVGDWDFQNTVYNLGTTTIERNKWRAKYYYEWLWDYDHCSEWEGVAGSTPNSPNIWGAEIFDTLLIYGDKLYLNPQYLADSSLASSDNIILGKPTDYKYDGYSQFCNNVAAPRYAQATIDAITTDEDDYYLTVTTPITAVPGHPSPFRYGSGIFWIYEIERRMATGFDPAAWVVPSTGGTLYAFDNSLDPWSITDNNAIESDKLSDIFRALLGDPNGGITLPSSVSRSNIIGFTTQGDLWSMIDWDDLDNQTESVRDLLGLKYWIDLGTKINIATAFWNELLLHGVAPVLEWGYNPANTREQWWIRFRKIGPANLSQAGFGGRTLEEKNLKVGTTTTETHSHTWIANKITGEMNFEKTKYMAKFEITYRSSFLQGADETGTIKIQSQISHYTPTPTNNVYLTAHFRSLMRFFAQPNWANKCTALINTMYSVALGREVLVTDRSAHDPATHILGLTEKPAFVVKMDHDVGGNGTLGITYRMSNQATYGWAPSVYIAKDSSTKSDAGGVYTITCTPEIHVFSTSHMRQDQMWFDCYNWNLATGYTAKTCSCANYKVIAYQLGGMTNPMIGGSGELQVTSVTTGPTIVLRDTSAGHTHYDNWFTTEAHEISFDTWDNCEACQKKWIFHADDNNTLGAAGDPAFRWE